MWIKNKALNIWYDLTESQKYNYDIVKKRILDKIDKSNDITYLQEFFNRTQKNGESVDDFAVALQQ